MAGTTHSDLVNLLKEEYGGIMHYIQQNDVFGINLIDRASGYKMSGKRIVEFVTSAYVGSSRYSGMTPSAFPAPGKISNEQTFISQAKGLFTIQVDIIAQEQTEDSGAVIDAWTQSFDTLVKHRMLEKERMFFSDGSGVLNVHTQTGGTGIRNVTGVGAANWTFTMHLWDAPKLRQGSEVWFWSGTYDQTNWRNATRRDIPSVGHYTVLNVNPDTATSLVTITVEQASPGLSSPANGDYVTIAEAISENAHGGVNLGHEPMGIDGIIGTENAFLQLDNGSDTLTVDTFQGLSSTTNSYWKSTSASASGFLMGNQLAAMTAVHNNFGTAAADQFMGYLCHTSQEAKYAETLQGAVRVMVDRSAPSLPGGRESGQTRNGLGPFITYSGKPVMPSRFCRADRVYAPNKKGVKKYILREPTFREKHLAFSGRPADEVNGHESDNIGTVDRACHARLTGLTVPSGTLT